MKRFSTLAALASSDIAIGFAVQVLVLLTVGVGAQTDAYFAGQAPTLVLLAIFQLPIQRAVVSTFSDHGSGPFPALRLYCAIILAMTVLVGSLCLVGEFALQFIYPAFTDKAIDLALRVLQIQGLAVAIAAGNLVLLSLNHVSGRFIQCEMALASSSFIAAVWVALSVDTLGVMSAAYGQLFKAVLAGTTYFALLRGQLDSRRTPWRPIWNVIRPLSGAGLFSKMAPLVDRSIASAAAAGSLTVLVFVQTAYSAAVGVADRAIVAPRLPSLKRDPAFGVVLGISRRLLLAGGSIVLALTVGALVLMQVDWVLRAVPGSVLRLLLEMLILLAGLPLGTLAAQWLAATLVFVNQTHISARIMTWCFLAALPVKFLGFKLGGIYGLALAMSCYYLASAASLWLVVRRLARSHPVASRVDT